ncbi:unnamed protein product [Mortierella alpina]
MSSAFSTTAAAVGAVTSSPSPSTEHDHVRDATFNSGGYLYMILLAGVLAGVIYFVRVCLTSRRARLRAPKDPDSEGPPTYLHHLQDLQIIDARPRTTGASGQLVVPSAPASALIRGENYYIVTPRTHSRTGSAASSLSRPRSSAPATPGTGTGAGAGAASPLNTTTFSAPTTVIATATTTSALSTATATDLSGTALVESLPPPPAYEDLTPRVSAPFLNSSNTPLLVAPSAPPSTDLSSSA